MWLKHRTLIRLKTNLIDIVGKETYYLMLTLTVSLLLYALSALLKPKKK